MKDAILTMARKSGLYWLRGSAVDFATSPPIVVVTSDDWGAYQPPSRETSDDLLDLADALRTVTDAFGRTPVFTAYMNSGMPDFEDDGLCSHRGYACTFTYADAPALVDTWRGLVREGLFQIEFHGREHFNVPLWLSLLREGRPGFREAFARREIPVKADQARELAAGDRRFEFIFRPFLDASVFPPQALPVDEQRRAAEQGLRLIRDAFSVSPTVVTAPGHVWDLHAWQGLRAGGIEYIETPVTPIITVDTALRRRPALRLVRWYSNPQGLLPVIRNCSYEPGWKGSSGPVAADPVGAALRQIRAALRLGMPAVVQSHAMNFTGDAARRQSNIAGLRKLLDAVRAEFPGVAFLGAADLAHYMHGKPEKAVRQVPFEKRSLGRLAAIGNAVSAVAFRLTR